MSSFPYRLANHARVCVVREGAVFLDLRQDAYLGIDATQARALAPLIEGWPIRDHASPDDASEFADGLRVRGLLVRASRRPGVATLATPAVLPAPREELIAWDEMSPRHITLMHVLTFLRVYVLARLQLRFLKLERIVHAHQPTGTERDFDFERARLLTSAYQYIRTWVFARKGKCMLDSLTMLKFLAHYGVRPAWVIGVQVRPFSAHSWLQYRHWVLNGTPAFVRAYAPILVS